MRKKISKISLGGFLAVLGLAFLATLHLYLISKTFYIDPSGNFRTAVAGYGDIPLHLTQISKFAFTKWNLMDPIYAGARLQYPFILSLICGVILKATHSWSLSVLGPVYLLATANIVLLFIIYKKILKKSLWSFLAVLIFFFGGGMGAYRYIKDAITNHQSFHQFSAMLIEKSVSTISKWDAVYPNQNLAYGSPISLVFLHQRTFFLGLFGFLVFLWLLFKLFDRAQIKYAILVGIILGLLPLWHTHAYVAAMIVAMIGLVVAFAENNKILTKLIGLAIGAGIILAIPQLWYLMSSKNALGPDSSFLALRLGWMVAPTIGAVTFGGSNHTIFSLAYLKFLWVNFGLILPLFIAAATIVKKNMWLKISFFSGLALFLAVMFIRFQPWDYDNNKILVYFQVLAAPVITYLLMKIYERFKLSGVIAIVAISILLLYSGLLDNLPRFMVFKESTPIIFDTNAQKMADYIKSNIPEQDQILTGNTHLNLVSSLAGREVLEGYPGWLWTRGIDYGPREDDIKSFYANPSPESPTVSKYSIKYILLDDQARYDFGADPTIFDQTFSKVYEIGDYSLYRI